MDPDRIQEKQINAVHTKIRIRNPESKTEVPLWGEESIPGSKSGIEYPSDIGWRAGTTTLFLLGS
jgi:hypothetical protein